MTRAAMPNYPAVQGRRLVRGFVGLAFLTRRARRTTEQHGGRAEHALTGRSWPRWHSGVGSIHLTFQRLDPGVAEAEVVGDLVDQHVADQAVEGFAGLDPFQQDRLAVEEDQIRLGG